MTINPNKSTTASRRLAAMIGVAALLGSTLAASPVGAADELLVTFSVVLKADSADDAIGAAEKEKAVYVGVVSAERTLYAVEKTFEVKEDDLIKTADDFVNKMNSNDLTDWAVLAADPVNGTRFYAWRFYAWTSGRASAGSSGFDLVDFLDVGPSHEIATGQGVTIAVLDTGFDTDHPLLIDRLLPGIDLAEGHSNVGDWMNRIDDDGDGQIDESHGHGTFVSGLIAQIAPDAKILPIRVLEADGIGEMYSVIDGIDEAVARGADVINISFGTSRDDKALKDAIERAQKAGVVIVASAGNNGSDAKQYPAAYKKVVAVAAYDPALDGVAPWGSYGDWIDVSAPGVSINSSVPGGQMGVWSGSSLSAPVVAGQVALLMELDREKTGKDAEKMIRDSARKSRGDHSAKEGLIDLLAALEAAQ